MFASVGLFALAVAAFALGFLTSSALVGVAVISFVLSCMGFLVVALLALGRAASDEG